MSKELLRKLPSVDSLKQSEIGQVLAEKFSSDLVTDTIRNVVDSLRERIVSEDVGLADEDEPENDFM